jgi:hypothetical protein
MEARGRAAGPADGAARPRTGCWHAARAAGRLRRLLAPRPGLLARCACCLLALSRFALTEFGHPVELLHHPSLSPTLVSEASSPSAGYQPVLRQAAREARQQPRLRGQQPRRGQQHAERASSPVFRASAVGGSSALESPNVPPPSAYSGTRHQLDLRVGPGAFGSTTARNGKVGGRFCRPSTDDRGGD